MEEIGENINRLIVDAINQLRLFNEEIEIYIPTHLKNYWQDYLNSVYQVTIEQPNIIEYMGCKVYPHYQSCIVVAHKESALNNMFIRIGT